jgi:riboflavin synthase alpha subunit
LVADKERLHAGFDDFRHHTYSTGVSWAVKGICLSVGEGDGNAGR